MDIMSIYLTSLIPYLSCPVYSMFLSNKDSDQPSRIGVPQTGSDNIILRINGRYRGILPLSAHDLDPVVAMSSPYPVCLKVLPVDSKDLISFQYLRSDDEGSICKIHRVIRVLVHQLKSTLHPGIIHEPNEQAAFEDKVS